jgi:hypothetical protein
MAMVTTDTGSRTVGALLRTKGEEFLKKLHAQEITMHSVSGQAMNDMILSGEVEASPTIFRNHALVAAAKGAPVAWVPMDVVPASPAPPKNMVSSAGTSRRACRSSNLNGRATAGRSSCGNWDANSFGNVTEIPCAQGAVACKQSPVNAIPLLLK